MPVTTLSPNPALSVVPSGRAAAAAAQAPDTGVAVLDRQRRFVWCNARAEEHLGMDASRLAMPPENEGLRDYLAAGAFATPLLLDVGAKRISVQVLQFIDSDWLLLTRDAGVSTAEESVRRDLVADTSHELRAPLCVMGGLIETMTELEIDPGQSQHYLDMMAEQCRRMRNIVEGLLELTSLEVRPEQGRGERIAIGRLLARLHAEANVLSGGRHSISLDVQPGYDLLGSERDITSALNNLVTNAVRYTGAGGEIRITWRASAKGGEFAVEDTGVGIDAKHIPLLTERFYRVSKSAQGAPRKAGGAGLGLAIVKAALARHQASLHIASEAGKGSRFTARFPAHRVVPVTASVASLAA
jgi:two-component system phosphate regulon sensor histidine kinase PhoR